MSGFRVQKKQCATCIYKPSTPLDTDPLEAQCKDKRGDFQAFRVCHHSKDACCNGFWHRHKDDFNLGRIAQRLGCVEFVNDDTLARSTKQKTTKGATQ